MGAPTDTSPRPWVVSFESRRAADMQRLLERQELGVISAPSMREVPSPNGPAIDAFAGRLLAGECDGLVLLTGVGTELLIQELESRHPADAVRAALSQIALCCRGPKPVSALRRRGYTPRVIAPEPNTWEDLLTTLDAELPVQGLRLVVQEYGAPHERLAEALRLRGAEVSTLQVYAWALPQDIEPLEVALRALAGGEAAAVLFTSAHQVSNVLRTAGRLGVLEPLQTRLRSGRLVVASIGPITTAALRAADVPVHVEPEHPKMGHLAQALGRHFQPTGDPTDSGDLPH